MISGIKYLHVLTAMQPGLIISQRMVLYKCVLSLVDWWLSCRLQQVCVSRPTLTMIVCIIFFLEAGLY